MYKTICDEPGEEHAAKWHIRITDRNANPIEQKDYCTEHAIKGITESIINNELVMERAEIYRAFNANKDNE